MSINPTKDFTTIRKLCIARVLPDFLSVLLLGLDPFGVATDTLRISNAQLGSHIGNHSDGNIDRIKEKGCAGWSSSSSHFGVTLSGPRQLRSNLNASQQ